MIVDALRVGEINVVSDLANFADQVDEREMLSRFEQSMSDWTSPQNHAGESNVLSMASKLRPKGTTLAQTAYV